MTWEEVGRVAVIAYHSSPLDEPGVGDAGGMTVYVRRLAMTLAERGISTDIFTRAASDVPAVSHVSPDVRVVSIEAGPRAHLDKDELSKHLDAFTQGMHRFATDRSLDYDIVHSHYWQSGIAGLELATVWDAPLVHSAHTLARVKNGYLAPGDSPEPQSRIDGEARVIAGADVLIASTDAEWQQLSCLYAAPHDRLKTIHPGVDHGLFTPGDRRVAKQELGLGDEAVMLFVGRIQPLKGLDLAIKALGEISKKLDRKVVLLVVGGPSGNKSDRELERLRSMADERGLGGQVSFVGPQTQDRLPVFYRAADFLAVCSHSESFGLSALEAQACGTPVIGTPVGGLSYVVVDGASGYLIDRRDEKVFADRALALLQDADLFDRFSETAVKRASAYSWEQTADAFRDLYVCLVNERAPEFCTC